MTPPAGGSETGTTQTSSDPGKTALGSGLGEPGAPNGDKGAEPPKPDAKSDSKAPAPEKYSDWKLPDGYSLDSGINEEAGAVFRELGLSQEQGQKLVDFYSKHAIKSWEDQTKAFWDIRREWRDGLKADPELGKLVGKDGNFGPDSPLISTINRALNDLQNPKLVSDFKDAMELTGAGDNPSFIRILHALASKVTEGTSHVQGNPNPGGQKRPSPGAALYPNLPSAQG